MIKKNKQLDEQQTDNDDKSTNSALLVIKEKDLNINNVPSIINIDKSTKEYQEIEIDICDMLSNNSSLSNIPESVLQEITYSLIQIPDENMNDMNDNDYDDEIEEINVPDLFL